MRRSCFSVINYVVAPSPAGRGFYKKMRDFLKTLLGLLLIAGVGFVLGLGYARRTARNKPETPIISKADTSSSVEPIGVEKPKIKDSTVIHHVWVKLPIVPALPDSVPDDAVSVPDDAVSVPDSAFVDVPIERKVYQEDSVYRAVVSGYRPSLDSLLIFSKTTTITVTNTVPEYIPTPRRRWSFGITAGPSVLVTPDGRIHGGLGGSIGWTYNF